MGREQQLRSCVFPWVCRRATLISILDPGLLNLGSIVVGIDLICWAFEGANIPTCGSGKKIGVNFTLLRLTS